MLSLDTALKLREAGLQWNPAQYDFFYLPFQDLDEQIFSINEMAVVVEVVNQVKAITFNGSSEWALDYVVLADAVWLPSEAQLRELLEKRLVMRGEAQPVLTLFTTSDGYCCEICFKGEKLRFEAFGASEAYGAALLHVLSAETKQ